MTANQVASAAPQHTPYEQRIAQNKQTLLDALKAAGVFRAEVAYEGCGDSGNIVSATVSDASNKDVDITAPIVTLVLDDRCYDFATRKWTHQDRIQQYTLVEALEGYVWDSLEANYPGWEINDGGRGTVTFNVDEGHVLMAHTSIYCEESTEETKL
jgi:hypothetical protein